MFFNRKRKLAGVGKAVGIEKPAAMGRRGDALGRLTRCRSSRGSPSLGSRPAWRDEANVLADVANACDVRNVGEAEGLASDVPTGKYGVLGSGEAVVQKGKELGSPLEPYWGVNCLTPVGTKARAGQRCRGGI